MTDREKVLQALEHCDLCSDMPNCPGCAYLREPDCMEHLKRDIIALLKEQEPRVMTLEEVNALDWDYCYLEQERLPGKEYRGMLGKYIITCVTWPSVTAAKISQGKDNYGRTWRCWTSRPTDEVRRATPWN